MASSRLLRAPELKEKLKLIKMLILDIDGVMTDGHIIWIEKQGWARKFSVKDGFGIQLLLRNGVDVAVISAADNPDVRARMEKLGIQHFYFGSEDKLKAFEDLLKKTGLKAEQTAYIGDELFDIPVLERVGFSATVLNAMPEVKRRVDYIISTPAGEGAVREIVEAIRYTQNLGPYLDPLE